jgi:polar amino acid transport system substrate-binding protein
MALIIALLTGLASAPALAQPREGVAIPFHGDPRVRAERPEGPIPRNLRVITDDEFPPLHFADPDGRPTGFSVELMRAVCERLQVNCTIQARRFDTLADTLAAGEADVIAAALPITSDLRARFHVSRVYHRFPARFLGSRAFDAGRLDAGLAGVKVAVVRETAHWAFLQEHFPQAARLDVLDLGAALLALERGEAELVFGDGQQLALWLGARDRGALGFLGGPYLSPRHFGEGIGFVLRPDEPHLKRAVDHALQGLWEDGGYARLFLRYFPISAF